MNYLAAGGCFMRPTKLVGRANTNTITSNANEGLIQLNTGESQWKCSGMRSYITMLNTAVTMLLPHSVSLA